MSDLGKPIIMNYANSEGLYQSVHTFTRNLISASIARQYILPFPINT